jgi:hypothetical protein
MRSVNRWVAAAAVAGLAAGCGNYSTEDLRFLSALPQRDDLRVAVPATAAPAAGALTGLTTAAAACPAPGEANLWLRAKETSDGLNSGVDFVVGLIDAVRKYPPTARDDDYRRWGPFDDDKHPGREIQVVIERKWPSSGGGAPRYEYRFEARVKGTSTFTWLIWGFFDGASASRGSGEVTLDFEAFWASGMNDAGTPRGSMVIGYDRASQPVTIDLDLFGTATGGFGVPRFAYGFSGYADGGGAFDYLLVNALSGDKLTVKASWSATKAGRLNVFYEVAPPSTLTGTFDQCWDSAGCLVYVNDPANLSCPVGPCSTGLVSACATVPVPPF